MATKKPSCTLRSCSSHDRRLRSGYCFLFHIDFKINCLSPIGTSKPPPNARNELDWNSHCASVTKGNIIPLHVSNVLSSLDRNTTMDHNFHINGRQYVLMTTLCELNFKFIIIYIYLNRFIHIFTCAY